MRKNLFAGIICLLCFLSLSAQEFTPVFWSVTSKIESDTTAQLFLKANINKGWHLYGVDLPDGGPQPTTITFAENEEYQLVGELEELCQPMEEDDEILQMTLKYYKDSAVFMQRVKLLNPQHVAVRGEVSYMCCDDQRCLPPTVDEFGVKVVDNQPVVKQAEATSANDGVLWSLIIEAILWGFAALLTPCVFPMIPMTVSFFLKGDENKSRGRFKAFMYYVFIVSLYTIPIAVLIILTRIFGGDAVTASIFNWLSTHWLPNLIFFIVFMVFAASFFGAFEIILPEKMVNGSDKKSEKKGLWGVFFMALTLVLVSFACTGPIVGTVLIKSTSGEFFAPIVTMLAFSLAFGLPFALFAFFPSLLKNLPKSGGWLNSVKVVLGFLEVALGFKFLSVADQTYHWGLLDREVYLAIWIVVFTLLGFYLLGKIRFKYDDEVKTLSITRLALSIAVFSFVVYMIPGMWGAPLKALSGYLPPQHTLDFDLTRIISEQQNVSQNNTITTISYKENKGQPLYSDRLSLPHNLKGYFDYDEALVAAKEQGEPLFVAFTGHGCVNCREMEARVWSDPRVLEILRNDYIVVALYVDDKSSLDPADPVFGQYNSIGAKNAELQIKLFKSNAQPFYCLLDEKGQLLAQPRAYNLDVEAFVNFLKR